MKGLSGLVGATRIGKKKKNNRSFIVYPGWGDGRGAQTYFIGPH